MIRITATTTAKTPAAPRASLVLIFLIFVFSSSCWSAWTGVEIYQATREACQNVPAEWIKRKHINLDKLHAGRFPSENYTRLLSDIAQESQDLFMLRMDPTLPATAKAVLREPLFEKALVECYPQSTQAQDFFRHSIKMASRSGKFKAAVWGVAMFYGINSAILYTARWSLSLYEFLFRLNWSIRSLMMFTMLTSDTHQENKVDYTAIFPDKKPDIEAIQAELLQSTNVLIEFHQRRIQQLEERLRENNLSQEQETWIRQEIERSRILLQESLDLQSRSRVRSAAK